tara:strand:- start:4726 stop:5391 length:666 start_codon:yes stop_codon:yes gene_type:complete
MKVLILDYKCGNIGCIKNIFQYLESKVLIESVKSFKFIDPEEFNIVVLPGVGNFQHASNYFQENIEINEFKKWILKNKKVVCICLGFQLLFSESEETDNSNILSKGLDFIDGGVCSLSNNKNLNLNIGWCKSNFKTLIDDKFDLKNKLDRHYFYHMHSYGVETKNIINNKKINWYTSSTHNSSGKEFISALNFQNVYGFQFHPEKSGQNGLALIKKIIQYG